MQTFNQYTTGIVLLRVAVSVLIYRDTYRIACIVIPIVSDDSRIVPALLSADIKSAASKEKVKGLRMLSLSKNGRV